MSDTHWVIEDIRMTFFPLNVEEIKSVDYATIFGRDSDNQSIQKLIKLEIDSGIYDEVIYELRKGIDRIDLIIKPTDQNDRAEGLSITDYNLQEYIKAIFDKTPIQQRIALGIHFKSKVSSRIEGYTLINKLTNVPVKENSTDLLFQINIPTTFNNRKINNLSKWSVTVDAKMNIIIPQNINAENISVEQLPGVAFWADLILDINTAPQETSIDKNAALQIFNEFYRNSSIITNNGIDSLNKHMV